MSQHFSHLYVYATYNDEAHQRCVKAEGVAGAHLLTLIEDARRLAIKLECGVMFAFNGNDVWVNPGDDPEALFQWFQDYWERKKERNHGL